MEEVKLSQDAYWFAAIYAAAEHLTIEEWLGIRAKPQDPELLTLADRSPYPMGYEDGE